LKGLRAMLSTKDNKTLAKKLSLGDEAVRRAGKLADTLTVLRQENQEVLADNTRLRREVERLNEKLKRTTKGK
jgi:phage shock protein A